jgi:hypothetical protein
MARCPSDGLARSRGLRQVARLPHLPRMLKTKASTGRDWLNPVHISKHGGASPLFQGNPLRLLTLLKTLPPRSRLSYPAALFFEA